MSYLDGVRHRLRIAFDRAGYERELAAERDFHLSLERMHREAAGDAPGTASAMARRRFGNLTNQTEDLRRLTPLAFAEQLNRDVRYALRQLWRAPTFSIGVVATFAIGIGANAAMFDVIDRLLLRPPAFLLAPDDTHRVFTSGGTQEKPFAAMGYRRYLELTSGTTSFATTAALWSADVPVGNGVDSREVRVEAVSGTYWSLFDARPTLGRFFTPAEDRLPVGTRVAVLSHDYWKANFSGRNDVIDRSLQIGLGQYEIVGVAPAGFRGLDGRSPPALYVPVTSMASFVFGDENPTEYATAYGGSWLSMVARRKPGVPAATATADLTVAFARSATQEMVESARRPAQTMHPWRAIAAPLLLELGPARSRNARVVLWLAGVAIIVLLIACANVANLLIARTQQRLHEFSVRTAIGVRRRRLLQQLLTETVVLALLGGAAGMLLSTVMTSVLRAQLLQDAAVDVSPVDARVLCFTTALSLLAGALAGAYPAWKSTRGDITAGLKTGPQSTTRAGATLRAGLLISQVALSLVLLVGASEFLRSMRNVQRIPLGFEPDRLLYINPRERSVTLSPIEREALLERMMESARATPDVESVSRANSIPFWNSRAPSLFRADHDSLSPLGQFVIQAASPDYFATMGTALLRGRGITTADLATSEAVIVVSDSMATRLWPGREAIGECIRISAPDQPCRRVVGIASAIRRSGLMSDDGLQYYVPVTQSSPGGGGVLVRTRGEARQAAERVRVALQPLVPGDGYVKVLPLRDALDPSTKSWRLGATMFTAFGALALLLACGGLYSVIAYDVTQRTHEMGVRMALGAQRVQVVSYVMRGTLRNATLGIGVGLGLTAVASPWMESLLFNVSPLDPLSCAGAVLALMIATLAASIVPARRAARIEPAACLRAQ